MVGLRAEMGGVRIQNKYEVDLHKLCISIPGNEGFKLLLLTLTHQAKNNTKAANPFSLCHSPYAISAISSGRSRLTSPLLIARSIKSLCAWELMIRSPS